MSKKAKESKKDLYYMKNGQAKNKTIIEEKERKKKEKEREKRIKEKKQETLKDEFDLETETVLQMTNRNRIKKEEEKRKQLSKEQRRRKKRNKRIKTILKIIIFLGIISGGITETEKNRFNSKFEILKGEELDNENVLKVVEAVKDNIINAQVDTNEEIKIEISRNESNQDIEKSLEEYIKKEKDKKYDIKIEYDEDTELVKYIIMTPAKKR